MKQPIHRQHQHLHQDGDLDQQHHVPASEPIQRIQDRQLQGAEECCCIMVESISELMTCLQPASSEQVIARPVCTGKTAAEQSLFSLAGMGVQGNQH